MSSKIPTRKILIGLAVVAAAPVVMAAGQSTNLATLQVMKAAKPGLWQHSFATIPANPAAKPYSEKGCVSQAALTQMINQAASPSGQDYTCDIQMKSDFATKAEGVIHCPAVQIPALGVNAPAGDLPILIEKSGNEEHWVVSVKTPAVPGSVPAATWRHEYRRLGSCPG